MATGPWTTGGRKDTATYSKPKMTPQKKHTSTSRFVLPSSPYSISSLGMSVSLEELQAIVESENIRHECGTTRETVCRCCLAFRESGRFDEPISYSKIDPLLNIDSKTLWHHWKHYQKFGLEDGDVDRLRIFSEEQMHAVLDGVIAKFHAMQPASCNHLVCYSRTEFRLDILPDTLQKIFLRDERLKYVIGLPMELQHSGVSPDEILQYFDKLSIVFDGTPSGFVWNMDEFVHAEWPNTHPDIIYVLPDHTVYTAPIAVSRTGKRITVIGCICADGSFATPMLIIPRNTTDPDLTLFEVSDRNCHLCHQSNSFIDREPFEWWFAKKFSPKIEQRRGKHHYHGPALLILGGCTAHHGYFF
jgi:hypothetical protein